MIGYTVLAGVTLALGGLLGWLAHSVRAESAQQHLATELARTRAQLEAAHARVAELGRVQAVESLVAPLHQALDRVQAQLHDVERHRAGSQAALVEQIQGMRQSADHLRADAGQLVNALRAPQVRGRWGEMQLERVVEAAGLTRHVDFVAQASVTDVDGTVRPDLVVHLVGGKNVVVDAKVAFNAYLEAMEAADERTCAERMKAHARQLRAHITALSAKEYWRRFTPTPEFVVCFVPADAFLDAALREDPQLLDYAFDRDVVLATPSTLVALLRTVAYTWRQDALAANAAEVNQLGRDLYARLTTMGAHVDKLGRSLGSAVEAYNQTVGSLESRVLVSARRFNDLHVVGPADQLPSPAFVAVTTRRPQAEEFRAAQVVQLPLSGAPPTGSDG